MNLLANAIDALEESNQGNKFENNLENPNSIIITTAVKDKETVTVCVADSGVGMNQEVKEQIFDHLFTTKEIGRGTGLGLAIVRQIVVEKHQGQIEVESQPGRGTAFVLTLPVVAY